MNTNEVLILNLTIDVPMSTAYAIAHKPENFSKWAAGLSKSLHKTDRGWMADTPEGAAIVRFTEPNDYGVLDHWVQIEGKPDVFVPLRLFPNGEGTEVELVLLRQPDMTDEHFERDAGLVMADLRSLKDLLERTGEPAHI